MARQEETTSLEALRRRRQRPHWLVDVVIRLVRDKPLGTWGGVMVLALILLALFADVVAPYGYVETIAFANLKPPGFPFLLGTDNLGRDVLSRIIYAGRVSLSVGFGAVGIGTTAAIIIGIVTGYFGGKVDAVVQRVVDAWMCFPWLVILLSIMAILGPGLFNVILALALGQTFGNSRVIRGSVIAMKENQYMEAARALGASHLRILIYYVLPNVMAPIIIIATLGLGNAIMAESSISFLGFGVPPPFPTWGGMLSGVGLEYMYLAWWMAFFPGVALTIAVFGFNMLGDALRDILDPRLRGSQ